MKKVNILGVNVTKISKKDLLNTLIDHLKKRNKPLFITTPNPEIILAKSRDEELFYTLNSSDIALPDGIGLIFAGLVQGEFLHRITGSDTTIKILKICERLSKKVYILNWDNGLSSMSDLKKSLTKNFLNLNFQVSDSKRKIESINIKKIIQYSPDVLFCTFGSPYQEKVAYHLSKSVPGLKISMAVGGSFDFLTGKATRAPKFIQKIGFEWLWRLFKHPKRINRIIKASIVFPYKFIKWRFILPFLYRKNVACMIYKKEAGKYKILLVERRNEKNHWQLPQGGTDGEEIEFAGRREIKEELGTKNIKTVAKYKNLHKYFFGTPESKFKVLASAACGYKGQKQSLLIVEYLGDDSDIRIFDYEHRGWKWVDSRNIIEEVHKVRKNASKKYIEKFNQLTNK